LDVSVHALYTSESYQDEEANAIDNHNTHIPMTGKDTTHDGQVGSRKSEEGGRVRWIVGNGRWEARNIYLWKGQPGADRFEVKIF
jgi:hypothetical protein